MIWRIRDRRTFEDLRRRGRRAKQGPLTVIFLADPPKSEDPARVAYAVSRRLGGAATRNSVKRRLRATVGDIHRAGEPALVPGAYLLIPSSEVVSMPHPELLETVRNALRKAVGR